MNKEELRIKMLECGVPEHDHEGILQYVVDKVETGGFLMAVFENDLMEAFGRADAENSLALSNITTFVYNYAPAPCWGSKERVKAWLAKPEVK